MIESLILGAVQGIAEWLPVSSEAMVVLVKNNLFNTGGSFSDHINQAIFLHMGTLLAAIVFFWKKVKSLVLSFFSYSQQTQSRKNYLNFISTTTFVSGALGLVLIKIVEQYESFFSHQGVINSVVAVFLLVTAVLLYLSERSVAIKDAKPTLKSSLLLGIFQGFAAIPGISRSGSTIAGMGLLGFNKVWALETSFILSIPLVFLANIVLNYRELLNPSMNQLASVVSAFVFGLLTISLLLRLVKRIRFSYFVALFGLLLLVINVLI